MAWYFHLLSLLNYHPQGRGRRCERISRRRRQGSTDLREQFWKDYHSCQGQLQPWFVLISSHSFICVFFIYLFFLFSPQPSQKCKWVCGTERRAGLFFCNMFYECQIWSKKKKMMEKISFGCSPVWKGNFIAIQGICISKPAHGTAADSENTKFLTSKTNRYYEGNVSNPSCLTENGTSFCLFSTLWKFPFSVRFQISAQYVWVFHS